MAVTHSPLPRTNTPEEAGVSSQGIHAFLQAVERAGLELHSFMVLHHGVVAAECYRAPFSAQYRHQMWSVSKTLVATALGFAVDEGLVGLDTPVATLFLDYAAKRADRRWEKLTLRHMATMTSGKKSPFLSPRGPRADWIRGYIDAPWYNEPGAQFRYVNENYYMLNAALRRATGMPLMEYLTPRLFEPLGIADPMWETDNHGIELGGVGFYCKTEDLAKFVLCYMNGGIFEGRRVIPAAWADVPMRVHTPSSLYANCHAYGYGMGFWRNAGDGGGPSWRAHGVFSQYGVALPERDAVFVCTAAVADADALLDLAWAHIVPALDGNASPAVAFDASPFEAPPRPSPRSPLEKQLEGRRIRLRRNLLLSLAHFPVGALAIAVTMKSAWLPRQMNDIALRFRGEEAVFAWREGPDSNEAVLGLDGSYRESRARFGRQEYILLGAGEWLDDNTFAVRLRAIETIGCQTLTFTLRRGRVTMRARSSPAMEEVVDFLSLGAASFFKNPFLLGCLRQLLRILPAILEPKYRGKRMK